MPWSPGPPDQYPSLMQVSTSKDCLLVDCPALHTRILEKRSLAFKSRIYHSLTLWPWTRFLTFYSNESFTGKVGISIWLWRDVMIKWTTYKVLKDMKMLMLLLIIFFSLSLWTQLQSQYYDNPRPGLSFLGLGPLLDHFVSLWFTRFCQKYVQIW